MHHNTILGRNNIKSMFFLFFKDLTTSFLNSIFWMKIEKLISFFPQYSTEGLLFFCIIYNIPSILNKTLYYSQNLFLKHKYF